MTRPAHIVLILSLLLGIQPVTTDLYLPALPALSEDFGASMAQTQLTLSALLLAFGCSQLVWGPLSDRFGRRPILLWGLGAYIVGALGSTFAPSMALLILWRALQGAAMGAAVMCARAIVRDLYTPAAGARAMSRGLSGLGVIACVSAPLGGLLTDLFGWRAALLVLAVFGAATLALVALRFEESLPAGNPRALEPAILARTWGRILGHRTFWSFALLTTGTYGGLFTFLASSSFVFVQVLGLSRTAYGVVMFSMSVAYLVGTVVCRRLLVRVGVQRTVAVGGAFSLAGGSLMGMMALAGVQGSWAIMAPMYLFMLGHGVHQPCGQSGAVGPFPQSAGAASALSGFLMMVAAFAMGAWLGARMDGTALPLVYGVWGWSGLTALVAWVLVPRVEAASEGPAAREPVEAAAGREASGR